MLIINGIVHTMDGQTIPRGFVAVSGGKIARVGAMEDCPAEWEAGRPGPCAARLYRRPQPPGDVRGRSGL